MLYREIMAVCSEIHTKHINTMCGQNVELLNVKLVVNTVILMLYKVNTHKLFIFRHPVFLWSMFYLTNPVTVFLDIFNRHSS
jgi:hypothetical protein